MKKVLFYPVFLYLLITGQNVTAQSLFGGSDTDKATCLLAPNITGPFISNIYVGGYSKSSDGDFSTNYGNYDAFIRAYDLNYTLLWQISFGGSNVDYIYDLTTDGTDIIAVGATKSNDHDIANNQGSFDYWVVKMDTNGNLIWSKTFGGSNVDKASSVLVENNTIKVLGYSKSTDGDITPGSNHGGYDVWLISLDTDGNLLSQKTFGGSDDEKSVEFFRNYFGSEKYISAFSKSSDGDLTSNNGNYDYWILKLDSNDNIIWQRSYGGSGIDKEPYICGNYNLSVAGSSNSTDGDIINPKGGFDIWHLILDEQTGVITNSLNIGGTGDEFATDLINLPLVARQTYGTNEYLTGYSNSDDGDFPVNNGNYDAWVIGINFGNLYNTFIYSGNDIDKITGISLFVDADMDFLIGVTKSNDGAFSNQHGNYDAWTLETDLPVYIGSINKYNIDVNIYPNPVKNFIQINAEQIKQISILDITGKQVLAFKTINTPGFMNLNLSSLNKGAYLLKVLTKKGVGIKKFYKL